MWLTHGTVRLRRNQLAGALGDQDRDTIRDLTKVNPTLAQ
jgi:hypothetical protein